MQLATARKVTLVPQTLRMITQPPAEMTLMLEMKTKVETMQVVLVTPM